MPDSSFTSKSLMDTHSPLGTGEAQYYIVPSGQKALLKEATVTNSTAFTNHFSMFCVPSGQSPTGSNILYSKVSLEPWETLIFSNNLVLESRESIHAKVENEVSGGFINLRLSGIEIGS